jgi:serine/threonine protein kinase
MSDRLDGSNAMNGVTGNTRGDTESSEGLPEEVMLWEPGTVLLKEYEVKGILGKGGMGTVYLLVSRSFDGEHYAVKTLLESSLSDEQRKKSFLQELRTWIDLPGHPNLVACKFFRTIESRIAIFAEYVHGGSLLDRIDEGKCTDIPQILDIMIQVAWGLEAAHRKGVIHQDIKPANILLTSDGSAKLTDFGLARARDRGGVDTSFTNTAESMVSSSGMTLAYCSPEQAVGMKLTHRTDMWSLGVSLLHAILGKVIWKFGVMAPTVLSQIRQSGPDPKYPVIPDCVTAILEKCFCELPSDRWKNMIALSEAMIDAYKTLTNSDYHREPPDYFEMKKPDDLPHDRRTLTGSQWDDPLVWLRKAFLASGRSVNELETIVPDHSGSRKARALIDLQLFDEAAQIYFDLGDKCDSEMKLDHAKLLNQKALVHSSIEDYPGSVETYDKSLEILEALSGVTDQREVVQGIAKVSMNKGTVCRILGEQNAAIRLFDRSIDIWNRQIEETDDHNFKNELAKVHFNRSISNRFLHKLTEALNDARTSRQIRESLVETNPEFNAELARANMNEGVILKMNRRFEEGYSAVKRAVKILEKLVIAEHHEELRNELAMTYNTLADNMVSLGKLNAAVNMYRKAIEIWKHLIDIEGKSEVTDYLASAYNNLALAYGRLEKFTESKPYYLEAIKIWRRLVLDEGRSDIAGHLSFAYNNIALIYENEGDTGKVIESYDSALQIKEKQVFHDGLEEEKYFLAKLYDNKASALKHAGENGEALILFLKSLELMKELIHEKDLGEIPLFMAWIQANIGEIHRVEGNPKQGITFLENSRILFQELIDQGQRDLKWYLGLVSVEYALSLRDIGRLRQAKSVAAEALEVLNTEKEHNGSEVNQVEMRDAEASIKSVLNAE